MQFIDFISCAYDMLTNFAAKYRYRTGVGVPMVVRGPWRLRCQVVRSERPRVHESSGRGPLGAFYRQVATLTPTDDGTDLDLVTEYAVPFGPVGRWIDRRWVDREPRAIANRELDRLVELVSDPR
jgi:hypothetical protein